jgi:hypothetical protein
VEVWAQGVGKLKWVGKERVYEYQSDFQIATVTSKSKKQTVVDNVIYHLGLPFKIESFIPLASENVS